MRGTLNTHPHKHRLLCLLKHYTNVALTKVHAAMAVACKVARYLTGIELKQHSIAINTVY